MRLVLTVLCLCLASTNVAEAQSDDFNPYQATLDAMPLEQAEPLIEAAYGPIENRYAAGIAQPYDGGPVLVVMTGDAERSGLFLFCEERLSAFGAPLTPTTAAKILRPLTHPGTDTQVYAADDGITFFAADDTLTLMYQGVGTKSSFVTATYPSQVLLNYDFAGRCEEVSTSDGGS